MASGDYRTELGINTSQYEEGMNSAQKTTKKFQKTADDTSKSVEDLGKKSKTAGELLKEIGEVEGQTRSVSNYRSQMTKLTKEIQDLTINYRSMSKEMQNSDLGKETLAKINELTVKASEYKDAIMDAQESIKVLASDTAAWDAVKQGIGTASAALQGFVSMGVLGEQSTEKLVAVIAKLKSIEAATNAVIQVGTALQKQSAMMMGVAAVQAKALAVAKKLEAKATGEATVAQKIFNAIALSNPYVLLATAIIAVGTALAAFAIHSNKAKKEQEELNNAIDEANEKYRDLAKATGQAAYDYDTLQKKYKECRTEGEKQEFLKEYKSKLEGMGISIGNLNDLERVFIDQTEEFRQACLLRAQYLAIENKIADEYIKAEEKAMEAANTLANVKPGDRINEGTAAFDVLKEYGGYTTYVDRWGKDYVIAADNATEIAQKAIRDGFSKVKGEWVKRQDDLKKEVENSGIGDLFNMTGSGKVTVPGSGSGSGSGSGGGKKDKPEAPLVNELDILKKQKAELEAQKKYIEYGSEAWYSQLNAINELDKKIKDLEADTEAYLHRLNNPIQPLEKIEAPAIMMNNKVQPMEIPVEIKRDKLVEAYKKAGEELSRIQGWLDAGAISQREAQGLVDQLNKDLAKKGLKADLKLDLDVEISESSFAQAQSKIQEFVSSMDTLGSLSNAVSAIDSVVNALSNFQDKISEAETPWEEFMVYFETAMTIFNGVATVIEVISTVMGILDAITKQTTKSTQQQSAANLTEAGTAGTKAAADLSAAGASGAAAAAAGGQSVASIPYVGAFMAITMIATIAAMIVGIISSLSAFAGGGIVGGTSYTGDKILARVNSGELILNRDQQSSLFNMINSGTGAGGFYGGDVRFVLEGDQLVGLMDNYSKIQSKI